MEIYIICQDPNNNKSECFIYVGDRCRIKKIRRKIDITNAFAQSEVDIIPGQKKIIMKTQIKLVCIITTIDTSLYGKSMLFENGKEILYVQVLKSFY